ncbi:hypothetical protein GCM10027284_20150 [Cyclobacterium sediminis]
MYYGVSTRNRRFIAYFGIKKVGNFQYFRSKLHYVKLEPVGPFPEAEPVEAVGIENVDNLPFRRLSLSKPAELSIQFQIELISDYQ